MRIAFLTHDTALYGANRSMLALIEGLREYDVDPYVLAPGHGNIIRALKEENIPHEIYRFRRWLARDRYKSPWRLAANVALLVPMLRRIREWEIDLIYTNSSLIAQGLLLAEIARLPHVWHIREFGDLDFGLKPDLGTRAFQCALRRSMAIIAVSVAVRDHVVGPNHGERSHVVYNGVVKANDADKLKAYRRDYPVGLAPPFIFAIVGALRDSKGQLDAIRALNKLAQRGLQARLIVAGSSTEDGYDKILRAECAELELRDSVEFRGYVDNPFEIYKQSDAVIMSSPYEAMGRVTAEAMAAACPVIGYNGGGTPELITNGQTGLLYDGTIDHLASCMQGLLERPELARSLGQAAWKVARQRFTHEAYTGTIHGILEKSACGSMTPYPGVERTVQLRCN